MFSSWILLKKSRKDFLGLSVTGRWPASPSFILMVSLCLTTSEERSASVAFWFIRLAIFSWFVLLSTSDRLSSAPVAAGTAREVRTSDRRSVKIV